MQVPMNVIVKRSLLALSLTVYVLTVGFSFHSRSEGISLPGVWAFVAFALLPCIFSFALTGLSLRFNSIWRIVFLLLSVLVFLFAVLCQASLLVHASALRDAGPYENLYVVVGNRLKPTLGIASLFLLSFFLAGRGLFPYSPATKTSAIRDSI